MHDGVASGRRETLLGSSGHEKEFVNVSVRDRGVDNCARHRVLEGSHVTSKDSGVDSLTHVDVHELSGEAEGSNGCFDLVNLGAADGSNLALTDSIAVEDDLSRCLAVVGPLESIDCFSHSFVKRVSCLLTDVSLNNAAGEILGC